MNHEECMAVAREAVASLLPVCARPGRILILLQDNPDPDAMASAKALRKIIQVKLGKRAAVGFGGVCGRAENRIMNEVLRVDAKPMKADQLERYKTICLVDTQPVTGNNILPEAQMPQVVIDHHFLPKRKVWTAEFADVRPEYGACSTILYEYLLAAGIQANDNLATALFYGIQSDTQDLGREASPSGVRAYQSLFLQANKKKLARIRRAPVPAKYFQTVEGSLANCLVAGKTVVSYIPDCGNPEIVAEVADLLIRLEGIRASVCYGICEDTIHLSARAIDGRANMAAKMKQVVRRIGTGGGHRVMAGGQVELEGDPERRLALVQSRIFKAFAPGKKPVRLTDSSHIDHGPPPPGVAQENT